MNYAVSIFRSAITDFGKNKGRTFLTSLGILIGVMSVVLLMAAGSGLKVYIEQQFESMGSNLLYVMPGNMFGEDGSGLAGADGGLAPLFVEKDMVTLKRLKEIEYVIPYYQKTVKASYGGTTKYATLNGTSEDAFPGSNLLIDYGTLFSEADNSAKNKVAVIGSKMAEKLFGDASLAIDKKIRVDDQLFRVIGVLQSKGGGGLGGPSFDDYIYIPYKTSYIFNTDKKFIQIIVKVRNEEDLPMLKETIKTELKKRIKTEEFSVIESTEILKTISSIFGILNIVLVAIAAISLVVGGIGILNIMYVTVSERIKEIGVRRALGARRNDILWQFLAEAVVLSVFGGALGLGLSALIVFFLHSLFPAYISLESVLLALGTSSIIGIVFGVFPAKKAADLSPIDAIRYE
ncbi:MAG TPA: ABC transporter permease [Spirochaetia bacterium]|nr:ABC transporter permease [Spirochaetia bacterium]